MTRSGETEMSPRAREVLEVARSLFRVQGYAGVSVDEIGAALGLTGPAIYRHFAGKGALLQAVVGEAVDTLEHAAARPTRDGVLAALVDVAVGRIGLGSAIGAELRHLQPAARSKFEGRIDAALGSIARRVEVADADGGRFRARALVAVTGASSFHEIELTVDRHASLVRRALDALVHAPPLTHSLLDVVPAPSVTSRSWLPRDEAVLAALPELLASRGGFGGITMEDLGAAAGLSGPSVYTYFAGKREVAVRAIERTAAWATTSLQQALDFSTDEGDVIRRALRDYVELSRRLPVFSTPLELDDATFDAATKDRVEAFVLEYRGLWTVCARIARPELMPPEAAVMLWAAHAVINVARAIPADSSVPTDAALLQLALAVFDA